MTDQPKVTPPELAAFIASVHRVADAARRGEPIASALDETKREIERLKGTGRTSSPFDRWAPLSSWGDDPLVATPPHVDWLLRDARTPKATGVLPAGKVGILAAPGGVGKTMALSQLALSVALGWRWLDAFDVPTPGRVLLALAEEDTAEIQRRLYNATRIMRLNLDAHAHDREIAAQRIVPLALAGTRVALTDDEGGETDTLIELRERLTNDGPWRLVILDPLSRWAGGDTEKDNAAATRLLQSVETLTKVPGSPAVLVAHHTNKASRADTGKQPDSSDVRGASGITDGARWVAHLERVGGPWRRLSVSKTNYALPPPAVDLVSDGEHGGALRPPTDGETRAREHENSSNGVQTTRGKNGPTSSPSSVRPIKDDPSLRSP